MEQTKLEYKIPLFEYKRFADKNPFDMMLTDLGKCIMETRLEVEIFYPGTHTKTMYDPQLNVVVFKFIFPSINQKIEFILKEL